MNKKIIGVFLTTIIAMSIFTGCSQKGEVGSTSNSKTVTTTEAKVVPIPEAKSVTPAGIKIVKSEITNIVKFLPYEIDGKKLEVLAVKANDGTIRTALNTCQVCFESGKGYYIQEADKLVCQNCGSKFSIDQIEKVKGGCNPVPVLDESKSDNGKEIIITEDYLKSKMSYFENWKK